MISLRSIGWGWENHYLDQGLPYQVVSLDISGMYWSDKGSVRGPPSIELYPLHDPILGVMGSASISNDQISTVIDQELR